MATKKKKDDTWPKITVGSHSTRTEYEDGKVDFIWDWDALQQDVREALATVTAEEVKPKRKGKK